MSRAYHNIVSLQLPTDAFFTQNKFLERQKKSLCNLTDIWHWSVNKKVPNTYYKSRLTSTTYLWFMKFHSSSISHLKYSPKILILCIICIRSISINIRDDNNFYKLQDNILGYVIKFTCHSKYTTLEIKHCTTMLNV